MHSHPCAISNTTTVYQPVLFCQAVTPHDTKQRFQQSRSLCLLAAALLIAVCQGFGFVSAISCCDILTYFLLRTISNFVHQRNTADVFVNKKYNGSHTARSLLFLQRNSREDMLFRPPSIISQLPIQQRSSTTVVLVQCTDQYSFVRQSHRTQSALLVAQQP